VAKDGLGTRQAAAAIARAAAVPVEQVACAGNRDRHGRSVQWFSVPAEAVDNPGALKRAGAHGKMAVQEIATSGRAITAAAVPRLRWKLRLAGAARQGGYQKARAILDHLRRHGCPNYHAPDAATGEHPRWGRLIAEGRRLPRPVQARLTGSAITPGRLLRAFQDSLFNRYVGQRLADGLLAACIDGDLIQSRDGRIIVVTDVPAAQRRLDSWEAVQLGPCYGEGMAPATGAALAREQAVLEALGIAAKHLKRLRGERRGIRFQPTGVVLDPTGDDLTLTCELPCDAHVAVLLDELVKPELQAPAPDPDADDDGDQDIAAGDPDLATHEDGEEDADA
jgi:tRNA pseudouridine13 synthase